MTGTAPGTGAGKTVCVTGANGLLASHVIKALLEQGYTVRGTVRDASRAEKYGWLLALAEGQPGELKLYSADLLKNGSFDEAVAGCDYVCHVAAAVTTYSKDPKADIVDPSVEGTRNVFDSILKAKCAKRVVHMSSISAIEDCYVPNWAVLTEEHWHSEMHFGSVNLDSTTHPLRLAPCRCAKRVVHMSSISAIEDCYVPNGAVLTEEHWHSEMRLGSPYNMAKTLAEKLAWNVYNEQKQHAEEAAAGHGEGGQWSFDLVVLNPSLVLGEILHPDQGQNLSISVVRTSMDGTMPLVPDFHWSIVHARDVALGTVLALEKAEAQGRYILSTEGSRSSMDLCHLIKRKFPDLSVSTTPIPTFLLYAIAFIDPSRITVDFVQRNAGHVHSFSNKKASSELGMSFIPWEQAVVDTAQSLLDHKVVKKPEPETGMSFAAIWRSWFQGASASKQQQETVAGSQ